MSSLINRHPFKKSRIKRHYSLDCAVISCLTKLSVHDEIGQQIFDKFRTIKPNFALSV